MSMFPSISFPMQFQLLQLLQTTVFSSGHYQTCYTIAHCILTYHKGALDLDTKL